MPTPQAGPPRSGARRLRVALVTAAAGLAVTVGGVLTAHATNASPASSGAEPAPVPAEEAPAEEAPAEEAPAPVPAPDEAGPEDSGAEPVPVPAEEAPAEEPVPVPAEDCPEESGAEPAPVPVPREAPPVDEDPPARSGR
ncbi:hypothetical protein [Streptomyces marincola]|uniref:hypothetical protein n=1 Tax=Streptomyces marincola TaxID=2878388 RepID=UPI001CF1DEF8|nr:hypothetical protein [Streptomyces marincola]UCM92018.1 hypothetical protein LC193_16615 [Streptomyces marincola]